MGALVLVANHPGQGSQLLCCEGNRGWGGGGNGGRRSREEVSEDRREKESEGPRRGGEQTVNLLLNRGAVRKTETSLSVSNRDTERRPPLMQGRASRADTWESGPHGDKTGERCICPRSWDPREEQPRAAPAPAPATAGNCGCEGDIWPEPGLREGADTQDSLSSCPPS